MGEEIVNKVAASGLITLDLADYFPTEEVKIIDLKDYLFQGLILREKDFRERLKNTDWSVYDNQWVAITCSADAIIPVWSYMLLATHLQGHALETFVGDDLQARKQIFLRRLQELPVEQYADQRIVIKGCGEKAIDEVAYLEISKRLLPLVKTIMYGEPCSTVPIYKKR